MSRFISWEPWLVGALAVVAVVYEPLLPFVVAAALLLRLVGWLGGRPLTPAPIHLPLSLLLMMAAISLWITPLVAITAQQTLRLLLGVLLCLALAGGLASQRRLGYTLAGVMALALLLAAGGLVFINWINKFPFLPQLSKLLPRLQGSLDTAIHPNVAGAFLAILLAGLLAWPVFRWIELRWPARLGWMLAAGFIAGVLFLTQARTALLALAVGVALLVVFRWRKMGTLFVLVAAAAILALVLYIGPRLVWSVLGGETGGVSSFGAREVVWLRARLIIADFPFTGVGMGTFPDVVDAIYPLSAQPVHMPHAHNLLLQLAVDLGLPGLLAWLGCWGAVLWSAWRLLRSKTQFWRMLGAAALCSQAALFVGGLMDCAVWDTRPAVIIWGLWGMILAAERLYRSENENPIVDH